MTIRTLTDLSPSEFENLTLDLLTRLGLKTAFGEPLAGMGQISKVMNLWMTSLGTLPKKLVRRLQTLFRYGQLANCLGEDCIRRL